MNCASCKYYLKSDALCRRFPPLVIAAPRPDGQVNIIACFPPMQPIGWCGEWEDKVEH